MRPASSVLRASRHNAKSCTPSLGRNRFGSRVGGRSVTSILVIPFIIAGNTSPPLHVGCGPRLHKERHTDPCRLVVGCRRCDGKRATRRSQTGRERANSLIAQSDKDSVVKLVRYNNQGQQRGGIYALAVTCVLSTDSSSLFSSAFALLGFLTPFLYPPRTSLPDCSLTTIASWITFCTSSKTVFHSPSRLSSNCHSVEPNDRV